MEAKTAICWKDCFKLLSNCMTHYNSTLAHELCNRLTPESLIPGRSCVSLDDYLVPQAKTAAVVAPCRYNSCRPDQVCVVNRKNPDGYSCLQGNFLSLRWIIQKNNPFYSTLQVANLVTDQRWLLFLNRGSNYRPFRPNVRRAIVMMCATVTEKGSSSSVTRLHHNLLIPAGLIRLNLVRLNLLNFHSYF